MPQTNKERNLKITTCNRLDLEILRFGPIMPKNSPGQWAKCNVILPGPLQ